MNRLGAVLVFIFACANIPTFSLSLVDLVGNELGLKLLGGESIKTRQVRLSEPGLLPKGSDYTQIEQELANFQPNVLVEALYFFRKDSDAADRRWSEEERTKVFNVLRSLSTLKGIEYFSASRGHMRVFYEESYVVDSPEGTLAIPDPVEATVPTKSTIFAVQRDLSFGENRYRYEYEATPNTLSFIQTNLTSMNYGILPVLGKERLKTVVSVTDASEGYLLYAVSAARATLIPGLDTKIKNSFSNRADAIYAWFVSRMTNVQK